MLDIGWSEMAVIALLALVIIGPKDLPRVMRTMGKWAHKARSISREFQSGIDEMVREADMEDARKTMQSVRSGGLNKIVEDTVDPTGSIKAEANDLQQAANSPSVTSGTPESSGASGQSSGEGLKGPDKTENDKVSTAEAPVASEVSSQKSA